VRRWLEAALLATGLSLVCAAGWRWTERSVVEARPQLASILRPGLKLAGTLDIPRLRMHVLVLEGDEQDALSISAEHVPGTAELGSHGNAAIAAHRDAEFRVLRGIRLGDRVRIRSAATYIYVVKNIRVVGADDKTALSQDGRSLLTLVTCYPFRYVGNAPERFIVQAELEGT